MSYQKILSTCLFYGMTIVIFQYVIILCSCTFNGKPSDSIQCHCLDKDYDLCRWNKNKTTNHFSKRLHSLLL